MQIEPPSISAASEATNTDKSPSGGSITPQEALVVVLILQILASLAFGAFLTSRPVQLYFVMLWTGYWFVVSVICLIAWPIITRRVFSMLVLTTFWTPIVWCWLWLFKVHPFYGWPEWGKIE